MKRSLKRLRNFFGTNAAILTISQSHSYQVMEERKKREERKKDIEEKGREKREIYTLHIVGSGRWE